MAENGSPYEFPCEIPVKVFGRNDEAFRSAVRQVVDMHFPGLGDDRWSERPSRESSYLSFTITVMAQTQMQMDALYTALSSHDDIMMVL